VPALHARVAEVAGALELGRRRELRFEVRAGIPGEHRARRARLVDAGEHAGLDELARDALDPIEQHLRELVEPVVEQLERGVRRRRHAGRERVAAVGRVPQLLADRQEQRLVLELAGGLGSFRRGGEPARARVR
jgi:hypothetical protein